MCAKLLFGYGEDELARQLVGHSVVRLLFDGASQCLSIADRRIQRCERKNKRRQACHNMTCDCEVVGCCVDVRQSGLDKKADQRLDNTSKLERVAVGKRFNRSRRRLENLKTKRGGRSLAEQPQSCPREDLKSTSLSTCIVWAQQRDTQLYNTQFDFFFLLSMSASDTTREKQSKMNFFRPI